MTEYFVGRNTELDAFKSCIGNSRNGIYFYGDGGMGKTQLLRRIIELSKNELSLQTSSLIDFFSTRNHSIEGIQNSIIEQIGIPAVFQEIMALRQRLHEIQHSGGNGTPLPLGLIPSLQRRIEVSFARCCNDAAKEKVLVLVFDSFEYVQERDVGRWFLRDFLPNLQSGEQHGIVVVFAGRPEPVAAETPENVFKYRLSGLNREELIRYLEQIGIEWGEDLEPLLAATKGNPLLIELIRWRGRHELLTDQQLLEKLVKTPNVMADEIFDLVAMPSAANRVLWAMATLKRRFDFEMLKYLVDEMEWLQSDTDYETIRQELQTYPFVKSGEKDTSHLLHDEAVEPISAIFEELDGFTNLREKLFRKIVYDYYPRQIEATQDKDERMYLQVEQLGYILDQDWEIGIVRYHEYREEVERQNNYDFEELLWGEIQNHFSQQPFNKVKDLLFQRSKWLFEHGLHNKREHVLRLFDQRYSDHPQMTPDDRLEAGSSLGYALMRQGKLREAEKYFQDSLKIAKAAQSDLWIAELENNLGQLMAAFGKHATAVQHYWNSLKSYQTFGYPDRIAAVYSGRGASLAMLGQYDRALTHCTYGLQILEEHPHALRQTHALRNIGLVYQLTGNYQTALTYLRKALGIAEREEFTELKAGILQELGRCSYLHGRHAREDNRNLAIDCSNQSRALHALMTSLEQARQIYHRPIISQNLLRLANVFEEIAALECLSRDKTQLDGRYEFSEPLLQTLVAQARSLQVPEEVYWLQHGIEHFPGKDSSELTLQQKVVRLFELGALEASEIDQIHLMVEGRIEAARMLLEMGLKDDVNTTVAHLKNMQVGSYDDQALLALGSLIQADLAFDRGDINGALSRYSQAVTMLLTNQGQISHLVNVRIEELFKRIQSLKEIATAIEWCRILQETWMDARMESTFPALLDRLQMLSHELYKKQACTGE